VVYWKGPVPASVRALVAGSGVPVRFRPARFTHHQLVREAQRLAADPRVAAIGPAADGSGLTVTLADTVPPVNTSQANNGLLATSTVPLTVRSGPRLQLLFSRDNDTSAYWGGGQTRNAVTGGGCSTGFAIWWNDARRMLTAAHCGINGQLVRDGGGVAGTDDMGPIINDVDSRDHQMIDRLPTKSYAGRIFTGPWSASTSIGVGGAGTDFVGNIICTGGSYSGEHCNTAPNQPPSRVTAVDQTATISGITISPLTVAVSTVVGGCIAAPGDSGGPVYTPRNDFRVDARGTITAGFLNVLCPNVFPGGPRIGTDQLWYAPVLRPAGGPTTGSLTYYDASPILG